MPVRLGKSVPEAPRRIARQFTGGTTIMKQPRAGGTADTVLAIAFQPSLRDEVPKRVRFPGVETPGYYQAFPRRCVRAAFILPLQLCHRLAEATRTHKTRFSMSTLRNNSGPSGYASSSVGAARLWGQSIRTDREKFLHCELPTAIIRFPSSTPPTDSALPAASGDSNPLRVACRRPAATAA